MITTIHDMNTMTQMRQYITRMLVLCMVWLCGVGSAWGQAVLETIGATDYSTGYLGEESNTTKQTLDGDGTVHFRFKNFNNNSSDNSKNFILVVRSVASPSAPLIALRADNWENVAGSNSGITNDYNWTNFNTQLNGATVDMDITRSGTTFTMTSTITTTTSTVYHYSYTKSDLGTGAITVGLSVENAYLSVVDAYSGWLINFADIGDRNKLADKAGAEISAAVSNGMGTVTLGEALNSNFGIQTGTTWLYRTAQKALYQGNGGNRNFGVFNAKAGQIITIDVNDAPTPTNATLKSTNGNVRTYEVNADGTVTFSLARYNYINYIKVENPSLYKADYTVRYVDTDGNVIKEQSTNYGTPGSSITLGMEKNTFIVDGQKYIYVSDDSEGKIVAEDGSTVVTITFRKAQSYAYSIVSNVGGLSFSGSIFEGENVTVAVPRYINIDGTLYETAKNGNDWYRHTYTINRDNQTETITYTATDITNVVFYAEAEDLTGATTGGGNATRTSKGLTAYGTNLPVTTLPPGAYKIYMHTANGNNSTRAIAFKTGDVAIVEAEMGAQNNNQDFNDLAPFTLLGSADITLTSAGSSASGVDYFYIVKDNQTVSYNVNYVDENGQPIKESDTFQGVAGTKVFVGSVVKMLIVNGEKYYYDHDDIGERTVAEGAVITLTYHKEKDFHYTVKSNMGTEIASGVLKERESTVISYPEHILVGSTLYTVRNNTGGEGYYRVRITPDRDNYEYTINYDGEQVSNVVFYKEAEEIAGVSLATNEARASLDHMAYTATLDDYKEVTRLQPGVYRLYLHALNGEMEEKTAIFKVGDRHVYETRLNASNTFITRTSEDIYVDSESALTFVCEGSNLTGIDNLYIQYLRSFEPTPSFTLNLRKNNGAIANVGKTLTVRADNAQYYAWYSAAAEDGAGTLVQAAKTMEDGGNIFNFTRPKSAPVIYYYCVATGYSGKETKSVVTKVVTVNENVEGAWVDGYVQDYESVAISDWISQNATVAIENHDGSHMIGINGENANAVRTAYLPLTDNLKYMTPDHVTNDWGLSFDFYPVNMDMATPSQQAIQIYKENTTIGLTNGTPGNNALLDNTNCFVSLVCNSNDYLYRLNVAGSDKNTVTLLNDKRYHMDVQVISGKISVDVSDGAGEKLCNYVGDSPFSDDILLGGIMYLLPRRNTKTAHAYFDNVVLKVMTTDLAINSDIPDFAEGNDDEYLNDGDGLNFDVPAATEFEWYVSDVAPSAEANGVDAPKLNPDGSVTWENGKVFMVVETNVDRSSTDITATNWDGKSVWSKNPVPVPTRADDETPDVYCKKNGWYAYPLLAKYPTVKTVWDEAVTENGVLRYYPEATASTSRWHYLRQLKADESDHLDYVWCVASNPLGTVTSRVAQISVYPQRPLISVHPDDETAETPGERDDMTLPANYMMRFSKVGIQAQNLIFNTANMPVPFTTKSEIVFRDEDRNEYLPSEYPATQATQWKHGDDVWTGVLSTTSFNGLDSILEANASVHGYYKNIPTYEPVDFVYGLRQLGGAGFHDIGSHGGAEYRIGPDGNASLTANQEYYYDYGKADATPLGAVSETTTWDWNKLPRRRSMTYNPQNISAGVETKVYGGKTYVVEPESHLLGPLMGQEYVMADFYGYKPSELNGFPSDKVRIGLEVVNDSTDQCMQGNAFIFKPTSAGTFDVTYSSTASQDTRYLEVCTRDGINGTDTKVSDFNTASNQIKGTDQKTLKITITDAMVGGDKLVVLRARNVDGSNAIDGTKNQYFRIYSATYIPDAKPVTFTEWVADVRDMVTSGGKDTYSAVSENSDGFVSLATTTPNAVIKYKIYKGTDLTAEQINDYKTNISTLDAEECIYNENVYTAEKKVDGETVVQKIGIHCTVNSIIFAWTELDGMNKSEVTAHTTHAAVYPVDLRFMKDFDPSTVTKAYEFLHTYWTEASGAGPLPTQSVLENLKDLSTTSAPKAWKPNAKEWGTAYIDGVEYTEDKFETFYITHGTTIKLEMRPSSGYTFTGWGAPSFKITNDTSDPKIGVVTDMMRSGTKAKHVNYYLLYDKAKAATTAGVAYVVANFTARTEPITAQVYVKDDDATTDDNFIVPHLVREGDMLTAPMFHTAHKSDGYTVTHWTTYYENDAQHYDDYTPGVPKKIYENTTIRPVYRTNTIADNYRGRSIPLSATWWFTTDHDAQTLTGLTEPGLVVPYVTPVKRSDIGMVTAGSADDITFDLPMNITPGATGRLDNTANPDWCAVGKGTKFTLPACPGAEVTMEVRGKLSAEAGGTTFGGEFPELIKVKYVGESEDTDITNGELDPTKKVYSYIYKGTYTGTESTLDIVVGKDYSYLRNISLTLPVIESKSDAALVTLNFDELLPHLCLMPDGSFPELPVGQPFGIPYGEGTTGDGYDFDHMSQNVSLYKTHYSKEHGAIYYDGVSNFNVVPGIHPEIPDSVPYVNQHKLGYAYSNGETKQGTKISDNGRGTFIVGPFRSITHIRYLQGCSVLGGGGWTMQVGRMKLNYTAEQKAEILDNVINHPTDPRRNIPDFSSVDWGEAKYGSIHNSTTPEWVEMDIEEHIYPVGMDNDDISLIEDPDFDTKDGDIWLRFQADKPNVYLFAIEIYGIDPTSDQQVTLETGVLAADNDADTDYKQSLRAGSIFHFPYLLQLDEDYKPVSSLEASANKRMQFNEGCEVTLTANPNFGYDFLKWVTPDGEEVSRENPYTFNINENTELRAVFVHRGIINYTLDRGIFGLVPDQAQTDGEGGFTVAENRALYNADGLSLRQWKDGLPAHDWYSSTEGTGVKNAFNVSTNIVGNTTPSEVTKSRGMTGDIIDVYPQFTANTLELIDVVGKAGATARWQFGKKNGAPTMEGEGTTPRLVTQVSVPGIIEVLQDDGTVKTENVTDIIDANMQMDATVNNAGRADAYATIDAITSGDTRTDATFTIPATKGMKIEISAHADTPVKYSINGGEYQAYSGPFNFNETDPFVTLKLVNANDAKEPFELEYIQATYYQRAQRPVLSMQKVDVVGAGATNNVQVQVQTSSNPTAVRFYTLDGSDPQYVMQNGQPVPKPGTSTRLVRGNFITINEAQIGIENQTQLKVLSVMANPYRPDSEISTLDLEHYDKNLGLATYVYDSRIIDIHQDQIFKKLQADHKGHFNLLSYDLNPNAAIIPTVITDHTIVFVTSDAVRDHLMTALTTPSDNAAHNQSFFTPAVEVGGEYKSRPFIVGTPTTVWWNAGYVEATPTTNQDQGYFILDPESHTFVAQNPDDKHPLDTNGSTKYYKINNDIHEAGDLAAIAAGKGWLGMTWQNAVEREDATATTPATNVYTELMRGMKDHNPTYYPKGTPTYKKLYEDLGLINSSTGGKYVLSFFDNMLIDKDNKICISDSTSNAPEYLNHNGTQLVFNATELLTRITNGTPADVSTYQNTLFTLMAPTKNPQLTNVTMTMTNQVIDVNAGPAPSIPLSAIQLAALADGVSVMQTGYLALSYPQFSADVEEGLGDVKVTNIKTAVAGDDLTKEEKLGAQGVKDLATIITLTHPAVGQPGDTNYDPGDPNFERTYRIEYNVPLDSLVFHRNDATKEWEVVSGGNELWTLTESPSEEKVNGSQGLVYRIHAPRNYGIKDVCFNGYATAPAANFDDEGTLRPEPNPNAAPQYAIWGEGEWYDKDNDVMPSPTAYLVDGATIPEYPDEGYDGEMTGIPNNEWNVTHFPWGYKDCNQMAFSLLNITDYVGDIKVKFYRRQAEAPLLLSAKVQYGGYSGDYNDSKFETDLHDGIEVESNGNIVLQFNSIMREVRKPGRYDSALGQETVDWTAHLIPEDKYLYDRNNPTNFTQVDALDIPGNRQELSAEGGTNTLTFQYWHLEEGKTYYLHIPFHILRGAVGDGQHYLPESYPVDPSTLVVGTETVNGQSLSWTNYYSEDDEGNTTYIPYFDIPIRVKKTEYDHKVIDYIVDNANWWDAYKEQGSASAEMPDYAHWDKAEAATNWNNSFTDGINAVKTVASNDYPGRYYMLVQKNIDKDGNPVAYTYNPGSSGDANLILFSGRNFSIVGEGRDSTIITAEAAEYVNDDENKYTGLSEVPGKNKSTIHLDASNVYMQDLTIQNTQKGSNEDGQEYPALFDHGNRNVYYNVNIDAYEESFAVFGTQSYLENSRVSGYRDFFVGSGDVWIESCDIVLRNRNQINLCAPSTKATNKWGLIFNNCNINREAGANMVLDHNWTLARPWAGYDDEVKSPSVTFLNAKYEVLPTNSGYGTLDEGLVLRFHEYGSKQGGLDVPLSSRSISNCNPDPASDAPVLTAQQAEAYSIQNVFGKDTYGYDPQALTKQAEKPVLTNDGMVLHWKANPEDLCYLVYYLGDGEEPDWKNAMMFCCVKGTDEEEAYCYLTNHDESPIFRTGETETPIAFSELWYSKRMSNVATNDYDQVIDGMGKKSPTRLWFAVRAANQMGGLSEMSEPLMYHAARQYRTTITENKKAGSAPSGYGYSTIYLDFQARAPKGLKAYALTDIQYDGGIETEVDFVRVSRPGHSADFQDVIYPDQGYLIYGPVGNHEFIETTDIPELDLTSRLSGTVGVFNPVGEKDGSPYISEAGKGEMPYENVNGIGWSITTKDYDNVPVGHVSAYTLQYHDNVLGFYQFTGKEFTDHRAYLDTDVVSEILASHGQDGGSASSARSFRIVIFDDGVADRVLLPSVSADGSDQIYDLMGIRVRPDQMRKGQIYIVNGRKVLFE